MKTFSPLSRFLYCVIFILYNYTIALAQHNSMMHMGGAQANGGSCCTSPIMSIKPLEPATIMDGIGKSHFAITTKSAKCQQFFDQGLALVQDFWDLEAFRSFKEAAKLDSTCAMAYWGMAFVLNEGHTYSPDPSVANESKRAIERAKQLSANVTAEEKAIINLVVKRDSLRHTDWGDKVDSLTSSDIQQYINQYPNNPDMVNIHVYELYSGYDEQRHPKGTQLLAEYILQTMLQKYPNHHGLNHYYIHAVEFSPYPERALPSAEKVGLLAPKSGHMVHMAGHSYYNTGDYAKARDAFLKAYKVDSAYVTDKKIYWKDYWHSIHNLTFMIMNCAEDGRLKEGLKWCEALTKVDTTSFAFTDPNNSNRNLDTKVPLSAFFEMKMDVYMRYGDWKKAYEIAMAVPDSLPFSKYYIIFCKGMAALSANDTPSAAKAAEEFEARAYRNGSTWFYIKLLGYLLRMHVLSAEGKYSEATTYFQKALNEETRTDMFNDPPQAVNAAHEIGIVYRKNKEYEKAIAAFNDELKVFRLSGQVYYQLAKTYAAWDKNKEAKEYYEKLLEAWKYGDSDLSQIVEAKAWLKNNSSVIR